MYKYVLNSVVKILTMFAKYFEYYTIILRGGVFFVDTLYCDVTCLKFKLVYNITTGSFQSLPLFSGKQHTFDKMNEFLFHKVVR